MQTAEYNLCLEEFLEKMAEKYCIQIIFVGSWKDKLHREQVYHKRGFIFQTCRKFHVQPMIIQITNHAIWPDPGSARLCLCPQTLMNLHSDRINLKLKSLWTFLAENFAEDKTIQSRSDYLTKTLIPTLGEFINFTDEFSFKQTFGLGFGVSICLTQCNETQFGWIYKTKARKFIRLTQIFDDMNSARKQWNFKNKQYHKSFIDNTDQFICSIEKCYWCPNVGCTFSSETDVQEMDRHKVSCQFDPDKSPYEKLSINYLQTRGENYAPHTEAQWLLNELGYHSLNSHFASYDIETVTTGSKVHSNIQGQNIISISVGATWKQDDIRCFIRKNSSPKASLDLIKQFYDHLLHLQKDFNEMFCNEISFILMKLESFENPSPKFKSCINAAEQQLKRDQKLKCFAYNSEVFINFCIKFISF